MVVCRNICISRFYTVFGAWSINLIFVPISEPMQGLQKQYRDTICHSLQNMKFRWLSVRSDTSAEECNLEHVLMLNDCFFFVVVARVDMKNPQELTQLSPRYHPRHLVG